MLVGSTAIIDAGVARPVVTVEKNRVVPVVIFRIAVIYGIVYNIIVKDRIAARTSQVDAAVVVRYGAIRNIAVIRIDETNTSHIVACCPSHRKP